MNTPIVFPASVEQFIGYQEQLSGRLATDLKRRTITIWLSSINAAYFTGVDGECITDDLEHMEYLISRYAVDDFLLRFLKGVTFWMCRAWVQGFNEYQKRKELEENDAD